MCRVCGQVVGNLELSDGVYVWPEGLAHYVLSHSVRLPAEFEQHTRAMRAELEEAPIDEVWWRSFGS